MQSLTIEKCRHEDHAAMAAIWQASVQATHHFLKPEDFQFYNAIVQQMDFTASGAYRVSGEDGNIIGFLGTTQHHLDMLFLHPDYFGKGIGGRMLHFAIHHLGVTKVDVNEDNVNAVRFYAHAGFHTTGRRPVDDSGKPYPILTMELQAPAP